MKGIIRQRINDALDEFTDSLLSENKNKIEAIMLYGSLIKGNFHPVNSDIDLAIISKYKNIDEKVLDMEARISLKYNLMISALLMSPLELKTSKQAGYLFPDEILKGMVLYERGKGRNKISF